MRRMWINQPSTSQPLHKYHGQNVLAEDKNYDDTGVVVWTLSGSVTSFVVPILALSAGWRGQAPFEQPKPCLHKRLRIIYYRAVGRHPKGPAYAGEHWDTVCETCGEAGGLVWYSSLDAPPGWEYADKYVRKPVYDKTTGKISYREVN